MEKPSPGANSIREGGPGSDRGRRAVAGRPQNRIPLGIGVSITRRTLRAAVRESCPRPPGNREEASQESDNVRRQTASWLGVRE